jgi:hypothetical protein
MSCAEQPEEGTWVPVAPNDFITKVGIRLNCQDQILNGEPYPPGAPWYIHLWGKCHPADCDWGEAGGQRLHSGALYFFYNQGFAKRYVYAQIVAGAHPAELWVHVVTVFTDPNRRGYVVDNRYRRDGSPVTRERPHPHDAPIEKKNVALGTTPSAALLDLDPQGLHVSLLAHDTKQSLPSPTPRPA